MYWFYELPVWISLPGFVAAFVLLSIGILLALRPWVSTKAKTVDQWDRVLDYSSTSYGIFYGIVLGLIAVSVYENYIGVNEVVLTETGALADLFRNASSYPDPWAGELQNLLRSYTEHVVTVDWPLMRAGGDPDQTLDLVAPLQQHLFGFEPQTAGQQAVHQETLRSFGVFVSARRQRIDEVDLALPPLLWTVLAVGAIINAVLISLIDSASVRVHILMLSLISTFIALTLYVMFSLDHPYAGVISIGPEEFEDLLANLMGEGRT